MDALNDAKTSSSPIISDLVGQETGTNSSIWPSIWSTTATVPEAEEDWFFSRIWTTIKWWFWSDEATTSWIIEIPTPETPMFSSWIDISWSLLSGFTTSGTDVDDFETVAQDNNTSWELTTIDTPTIAPSTTTETIKNTLTTTSTPKTTLNPPTKTTTPPKTTDSDVDPILDALF